MDGWPPSFVLLLSCYKTSLTLTCILFPSYSAASGKKIYVFFCFVVGLAFVGVLGWLGGVILLCWFAFSSIILAAGLAKSNSTTAKFYTYTCFYSQKLIFSSCLSTYHSTTDLFPNPPRNPAILSFLVKENKANKCVRCYLYRIRSVYNIDECFYTCWRCIHPSM